MEKKLEIPETFVVDKSIMQDPECRPITQGLFLELGYGDRAIYTLKDRWHEYNGKLYAPIRQFYIEMEDPIEYDFANKYFLGWDHWKRICDNRFIRRHIEGWREELELKMRARGMKSMILSAKAGNFQAAKWLTERGWEVRGAGRPTKAEKERQSKMDSKIAEEYSADVIRLGVK